MQNAITLEICNPICVELLQLMSSVITHISVKKKRSFYINPLDARSRYTGGTVYQRHRPKPVCRRDGYQRHRPEAGIPDLFSNAYWHRNARVIEIQTRQQLKNNYFHETLRIFMNKFCIWTPSANVRVGCCDFSKLPVYAVYSNRRPPSLFGEHCAILRPTWRMWKTLKIW